MNPNKGEMGYMYPSEGGMRYMNPIVGPPSFAQKMFARTVCCYAADRLWAAFLH